MQARLHEAMEIEDVDVYECVFQLETQNREKGRKYRTITIIIAVIANFKNVHGVVVAKNAQRKILLSASR